MRLFVSAGLAASLLALASASRAQAVPPSASSAPTDDELIAEGVALRKQGRDADALIDFERANALRPSARAAAQIALAHEALGHWREAEAGLNAVLSDATDAWVVRHAGYLQESLAAVQEHLAWLDVESNVAGTEVRLDGALAGRLPLDRPLRVVAGDVTVEVRAPDYSVIRRVLHVEAKSRLHEVFTFVREQAAGRDAPATPPAAPLALDVPSAHRASTARTMGWVSLAGAGGLLLAGIAGAVTREWEAKIYDDDSRCGPLPGESRYDRCGTHRDIGSTGETVAVVSFVGSGVAAIASGVLLIGSARSAPKPVGAGFGCRVGGLAVACQAAF